MSKRFRILAGLILLGACAAPPPEPPTAKLEPGVDLQFLRTSSKTYDEYVGALMRCTSAVPADWAQAVHTFETLHPFRVFQDDLDLIMRFRLGEEKARLELGRRGVLLTSQGVFFRPYDGAKWEEARRTLMASKPGGPDILVWTLLQLLLAGPYRDVRVHVRYTLVQAGEPALETAQALVRKIAESTPDTAVSRVEDLVHLTVLLIEFGDRGRACVEELAQHRTANVRRGVAGGIGEAVDVASAKVMARLFSEDPEWTVRATAAEAAGRMGPARGVLGPALVACLGREKDATVLRRILQAIGEMHYEEGVPALMSTIESPNRTTAEAGMYALYRITGEKLTRREEWQAWYLQKYTLWKGRPKP
jgi:hypothetical protein